MTLCLSKVTIHSSSHNFPIKMRLEWRFGIISACFACFDKCFSGIWAWCVDAIVDELESFTFIGRRCGQCCIFTEGHSRILMQRRSEESMKIDLPKNIQRTYKYATVYFSIWRSRIWRQNWPDVITDLTSESDDLLANHKELERAPGIPAPIRGYIYIYYNVASYFEAMISKNK